MARDFFDAITNWDPIKEIVPIAMQKFNMDLASAKFKMAEDSFNRVKDANLRQIKNTYDFYNELKADPNMPIDKMMNLGLRTRQITPEQVVKNKMEAGKIFPFGASGGRVYKKTTGEVTSEKPVTPEKPQLSESGKLNQERSNLTKALLTEQDEDKQIAISNRIQEIDSEIETKKTTHLIILIKKIALFRLLQKPCKFLKEI